MAFVPDFQFAHIGINDENAQEAAANAGKIASLFSLPVNPDKESEGASFNGTVIEWLKQKGAGTHGHLAFSTADLPGARAYLEAKGFSFDDATAKYLPDGRIAVICSREEIGGFAMQLLQR